jgi:hypothetical protein
MSTFDEFVIGGPWAGGVTESQVTIKTSVTPDVTHVSLVLTEGHHPSESAPWIAPVWTSAAGFVDYDNVIYEYHVANLKPDTRYYYALVLDGVVAETTRGSFKTFPQAGSRADFQFAFGSCSKYHDGDVFDAIYNEPNTLFFAHLGDLHYKNPGNRPYEKRFEYYDRALRGTDMGTFFKRMPVVYTWDDHDFLGNNQGGMTWGGGGHPVGKAGRDTARDAYDAYVPHYPLVNRQEGIFQEITVGRVRILLADSRFGQTPYDHVPAGQQRAVYQTAQWNWIRNGLRDDPNVDLYVLVSSFPWIVHDPEGAGNWGDFPEQREALARELRALGRRNVCIISGDAHMLAIDDGSHSGFAPADGNGGRCGVPVFHAASLSSSWSLKGGPYSHGTPYNGGTQGNGVSGSGQYGLFRVTYTAPDGANLPSPTVYLRGRKLENGQVRDVIWHDFDAASPYAHF